MPTPPKLSLTVFRAMKGIKQCHHFRFDVTQPGVVFRKEFADSEKERCELLLDVEVLPPILRPRPTHHLASTQHTTWPRPTHHLASTQHTTWPRPSPPPGLDPHTTWPRPSTPPGLDPAHHLASTHTPPGLDPAHHLAWPKPERGTSTQKFGNFSQQKGHHMSSARRGGGELSVV